MRKSRISAASTSSCSAVRLRRSPGAWTVLSRDAASISSVLMPAESNGGAHRRTLAERILTGSTHPPAGGGGPAGCGAGPVSAPAGRDGAGERGGVLVLDEGGQRGID